MNRYSHNQGFTLVEVLFAMFILAVGILGIIGLQLFAKQNNYDAIQRTTAAALATDIVERMRVNNSALPAYISAAEPIPADTPMPTPDPCITPISAGDSGCSPQQVAARDLAIWHSLISGVTEQDANANRSGGLVSPSACITQDPNATGSENEYRIAIAWRGRSALSDPTSSPCGQGVAGAYGDANEFRRLFVMNVFIETAK